MARRRFQRADQADSDCTPAPDGNKPLLTSQDGGGQTISATTQQGQMVVIELSFSTASGDPGSEDTASFLWAASLDVTAVGGNQSFTVGFAALNNACTEQGSIAATQTESTIGVHLFTRTWDAPSAERYQLRILIAQGGMMTDADETFTLRTNNTDAWLDLPDAPGAPVSLRLLASLGVGT